ncbi:hypothetical protein M758_1G165300 [Ceratodon purpureus]|nr:hypothetical protein M758_1G165300 [Ceratodon purpureus]
MAMRRNMFWQGRRALGDEPNKMLGESLWRLWARRTQARLDRDQLWDMVEPYSRPKPLMPLVLLNIAAFYTGVIAAAVTEQLHKERIWAEHPGQAIPIMKPTLYIGPYKVRREDFGEEAPGQ